MKSKNLIAIFLILLVSPVVYAEEETNAGVEPDSPLYGLERAMENLRLKITNDPIKKAELKIKYSNERLAEYKAMVKKNKLDKADKALEDYNDDLEEIDKNIEKAETKGKDTSKIKTKSQENRQKHIAVLQRVRENAPEQAYKGLDNAIANAERQQEKKDNKSASEQEKVKSDKNKGNDTKHSDKDAEKLAKQKS